ncbi:MAG TPA: type II toxin-antitoxin system VapC family toxin [Bryobacteraceae bacterium]|nr:type II toxin-antitoxin system VapC family toxin [Bryobacteraceae bacterium]
MIFIDSNIPMYLIGAPHPHKSDSQLLLERLIASGKRLVTDAEVFQEITHRYVAIGTREAIGPAFQLLLDVVDDVLAIEKADVLRAGEIVQSRAVLSARDSVHIAVMERHGIRSILSFDGDFDRWPGLQRIYRI